MYKLRAAHKSVGYDTNSYGIAILKKDIFYSFSDQLLETIFNILINLICIYFLTSLKKFQLRYVQET